jgi:hypothetical protein
VKLLLQAYNFLHIDGARLMDESNAENHSILYREVTNSASQMVLLKPYSQAAEPKAPTPVLVWIGRLTLLGFALAWGIVVIQDAI